MARQDWHWEDVKAALGKRGLRLTDIARQVGVVSGVASYARKGKLFPVQQAIADALSVHPATIWPSRYDAAGRPIGARRRRSKNEPDAKPETPQKQDAT